MIAHSGSILSLKLFLKQLYMVWTFLTETVQERCNHFQIALAPYKLMSKIQSDKGKLLHLQWILPPAGLKSVLTGLKDKIKHICTWCWFVLRKKVILPLSSDTKYAGAIPNVALMISYIQIHFCIDLMCVLLPKSTCIHMSTQTY